MFKQINQDNIRENFFHLIGKQWMLITAGSKDQFNTMTASWGGLGFLWNVPVAFIFIRPQRFTYQFVEEQGRFTLGFFESQY
jgi:flavin reductase (DIM6/NTAB) family NADH-FMN oxidoreductase RutF